jgi:hypothetical protein
MPASATSHAQGRVELVQPQGNYEVTASCPYQKPTTAGFIVIECAVYAEVEVGIGAEDGS